jgi:uncharacterized protein (DUF305 family)
MIAMASIARAFGVGLAAILAASVAQAQTPTPAAIARARADSARLPYTAADIHFMSGMIQHHAQAIVMAGWAKSHDASQSVQTLCERIVNAQQDEIRLMQQWLAERNQSVPKGTPAEMSAGMTMGDHEMLMPGMLTAKQMKDLDAAHGQEFDRLFLTGMIQHHRGAIAMVKTLFDTPGAGQDEIAFKLASDVNVDQTTEIARMQRMLAATLGIELP